MLEYETYKNYINNIDSRKDETMKIEKLFFNGKIITLNGTKDTVEAVAIKSGKIVKVGKEKDLMKLADENTVFRDLGGKTMIPGFIDSHSHFYKESLQQLTQVNLNSQPIGTIESIKDIIHTLKEFAQNVPEGQLIKGFGYDDTNIKENRRVTRDDLDMVSTNHPIVIKHISGHMSSVNTLGLELLGINENTPNPMGSEYVRDNKGKLTGIIEGGAAGKIAKLYDNITEKEQKEAIKLANEAYAKVGVTTVSTGNTNAMKEIELFKEAQDKGDLKLRVVLNRSPSIYEECERFKGFDDMLYKGSIKAFYDGSIQMYTGYLSEPYYIQPEGKQNYRGYTKVSKESLVNLVKKYHSLGEQLLIHGNGDAAIEDIIDAYVLAQEENPREDPRHVVIHCQMVREDQLDKMKENAILPSFFVLHTYYWGDRHRDIFMGPERAARMSPLKSALDRDLIFTTHCDTPVVPQEPMRSIWSSVNRLSSSGKVIGQKQRINVVDALKAYTINGAYQYKLEDKLGSIELGKFADLVVLSEDITKVSSNSIKDIKVLETIVGGKTVYKI